MTQSSEPPLVRAAGAGQLAEVQALLAAGADLQARDQNGDTALNAAARGGQRAVVQALLAAGADLETKGGAELTPLMNAVLAGQLELAQELVARGARVSQDLLSTVALRLSILEENAESGMVRPEAVAGWRWVLKWLQLVQLRQVMPQTEQRSAADAQLLRAAADGDLDRLSRAVQAGADVDASDRQDISALRWAARGAHVATLRALLDAGAQVNGQSQTGWTALMQAVLAGSVESVALLLERGADVQAKTFADMSALDFARDVVQFAPDAEAAREIVRRLEAGGAASG